MKTALISLQALMCAPVPEDPQDAVVAQMYKERYSEFVATARQWTELYARGNASAAPVVPQVKTKKFPHNSLLIPCCIQISPAVRRLMDMGFEQAAAQQALLEAKGDENLAVEKLLG